MQKIFDYFIEQLNSNTDGLVYKGNFLFRFETDRLSVYEPVEGKLVNEEVKYRPVALTTSEDVPFVENNNRVDWLLEVGMLVPINGDAYDATTDLDYANIQSVCRAMNGSSITVDGTKYSVKVSPYPKYRGWTFLGETAQYAILSVTFNLTELGIGEFGQSSTWYLDGLELDVVNADVSTTRRFYTADKKATTDNDFNTVTGRVKMVTLTINYDPTNAKCVALFNESRSRATLKGTYTLKETHEVLGDFEDTVIVRSANESAKRNSVRKLVVEFAEVVT
jgi:hypothetical protein